MTLRLLTFCGNHFRFTNLASDNSFVQEFNTHCSTGTHTHTYRLSHTFLKSDIDQYIVLRVFASSMPMFFPRIALRSFVGDIIFCSLFNYTVSSFAAQNISKQIGFVKSFALTTK